MNAAKPSPLSFLRRRIVPLLAALISLIGLGVSYSLYLHVRVRQAFDYRGEAAGWARMDQKLPRNGAMVGLVHAYGFLFNYYGWIGVHTWPTTADPGVQSLTGSTSATFEARFVEMTRGARYFLVTLKDAMEVQSKLKTCLNDLPGNGRRWILAV